MQELLQSSRISRYLRCYSGIVVGWSTAALTARGLLSPWPRIITLVITFIQGIYNYVPETNHVSRVCSVAAVLCWQSAIHVMLFRPWNMYCSFTSVCVVLSGRGLCDEPITRPGESYRLVRRCMWSRNRNKEALAHWEGGGLSRQIQKNKQTFTLARNFQSTNNCTYKTTLKTSLKMALYTSRNM